MRPFLSIRIIREESYQKTDNERRGNEKLNGVDGTPPNISILGILFATVPGVLCLELLFVSSLPILPIGFGSFRDPLSLRILTIGDRRRLLI